MSDIAKGLATNDVSSESVTGSILVVYYSLFLFTELLQILLVYLDDIIVYSDTIVDDLKWLE